MDGGGDPPEEKERMEAGENDRIAVFSGSAWGQHFMILS